MKKLRKKVLLRMQQKDNDQRRIDAPLFIRKLLNTAHAAASAKLQGLKPGVYRTCHISRTGQTMETRYYKRPIVIGRTGSEIYRVI